MAIQGQKHSTAIICKHDHRSKVRESAKTRSCMPGSGELDTPRPETPPARYWHPFGQRDPSLHVSCHMQTLQYGKGGQGPPDEQLPVLPWDGDDGVPRSHTCTKNG